MISDLQGLVTLLHADLIARSQERDEVAARLRSLHASRQKQQRSAQSYEEWREEFLTQVAAAWVLGCVFVRYLEDNRFLRERYLAGPDEAGLQQAKHNFTTFMHSHPDDAERNYLLDVFRRMQTVHAVKDLFVPGKTALWAVEPSNAAAMKLLEFWHEIDLIETDKNIGLIEQPEFKRRWSLEKPKKTFREVWREMEQDALCGWLLDRLETERYWPRQQPGHHSPAELKSCRELARLAALDPEFQQVGELYTNRKDFDVQKLVTELVLAESVPFLPILRYTDAGLRKREVWERVWDKQREEDRFSQRRKDCKEEGVSSLASFAPLRETIEIPPKYKKEDFQKDALGKDGLWRLRGELDVPKERWISYPPLAQRQGDEQPSPVVTWAGYNHLDQALALAKYFDERKDRDTGSKEWMLPFLAGLEQLRPWLLQWHNEPDPAYEGQKMGEYFRDVVLREALQTQGLTMPQCCAWRPPAAVRKPRQTRKK